MKKIGNLNLAVLAIVGAVTVGCSDAFEDITPNETVTLTTTLNLGDAGTKALSAAGTKTFAVGDQIAVVYKNTSNQTIKAVSDALIAGDIHNEGTKADITVTLTNPATDGALRYIYPAAMAKATIATNATVDDAGTIDFTRLNAQDGTLASLASDLDLAVFDGNLTGEAALPVSATLENQLTIGEFTIKNADGSLNATSGVTSLIVTDGINTYTVTPEAPASHFGDGPIYVAMRAVSADKTLTFTANADGNNYVKNITGKTLSAGHMYPVGLKFTSIPHPMSKATSNEVGMVICSNGYVHSSVTDISTTCGSTASGIIAYVGSAGSVDESSATYKGLAIGLTNAGSDIKWTIGSDANNVRCVSQNNSIATALTYLDGITCTSTLAAGCGANHNHPAASTAASFGTVRPAEASGWFLPSLGQWNLIVKGLAAKAGKDVKGNDLITFSDDDLSNLTSATIITTAGGTSFGFNVYWSTTEFLKPDTYDNRETDSWLYNGTGKVVHYSKTNTQYVRAIFAF